MNKQYITSVYGSAKTEYVIKKSRFITHLQEVHSEQEATAFLEKIRKAYWDASHNCYAWQIGSANPQQKASDDGEPSGTAGRPMLEVLKKREITNTAVIVTRYFGGIKLGASGLIRAYSHSVAAGLDAADIADYLPYTAATVTFEYSFINSIERLCPNYNVRIVDRAFTDTVTYTCQIPENQTADFQTALTNAASGKVQYASSGTTVIPVIRAK